MVNNRLFTICSDKRTLFTLSDALRIFNREIYCQHVSQMQNTSFQDKFNHFSTRGVGHIIKSYIFALPLKTWGKTADVAQLARARDL